MSDPKPDTVAKALVQEGDASSTRRDFLKTGAAVVLPKCWAPGGGSSIDTRIVMRGASAGRNPTNEA